MTGDTERVAAGVFRRCVTGRAGCHLPPLVRAAVVRGCELTITRHRSSPKAVKSKRMIDDTGCGGACVGVHVIAYVAPPKRVRGEAPRGGGAVHPRTQSQAAGVVCRLSNWVKGRIAQYGFVEGKDDLTVKIGEQHSQL